MAGPQLVSPAARGAWGRGLVLLGFLGQPLTLEKMMDEDQDLPAGKRPPPPWPNTQDQIDQIKHWFVSGHLPDHLKEVVNQFQDLINWMVHNIEPHPEMVVALRKLLEAKDAAVRARLAMATPLDWSDDDKKLTLKFTINGKGQERYEGVSILYEDVCELAGFSADQDARVTYTDGGKVSLREGTLFAGEDALRLKEGMLFTVVFKNTVPMVKFTVNGKEHELDKGFHVDYTDVCALANKDPELFPTVTWHDPEPPGTNGTLIAGEQLQLQERMIFTVEHTSSA